MPKKSVTCLVMATLLEAKPFIKNLSLIRTCARPFPVYLGEAVAVIISGIGKTNAAMATTYACLELESDLLINLGAAGATDASLAPGSSLEVERAVEFNEPGHHYKTSQEYIPDILKGFQMAAIATVDRPLLEPAERKKLAKRTQLVDMESAAFIQACRIFGKKCYVFKFISDTPAHTSGKDIVTNIKKYRDGFFRFFKSSIFTRLSDGECNLSLSAKKSIAAKKKNTDFSDQEDEQE